MTSLEHVLVGHAFNQAVSWTGDGGVAGLEVRDEVEEVNFGLAVTTAEDEDGEGVGMIAAVGDVRGRQRIEHRKGSGDGEGSHGDQVGAARGGVGLGSSPSSASAVERVGSRRHPSGVSLRQDPALRTRSVSHSNSNSNSRSHSSVTEGMDMGESSAATSWTQADAEGRPSAEACYRPSTDRPEMKGDVDVVGEVEAPKLRAEVPLSYTHTNTNGEEGVVPRREEVLAVQEGDTGEGWHPLQYNSEERSQDHGEGEKGEGEMDVGSVHALESIHGGDPSLEMNEKERERTFGSSGRNKRHLRLEFKRPSPQPWDEIDPPADNNEAYSTDYYSTLNSKKFGTLQKSRRRPLIPHSTFYFGPPPPDSAYGTPPVGQIGVHHPREIVRIERDYVGGELIQFSPIFPLELEGRITPTQFHQTINDINEILISAHGIQHAFVDNLLAVATLQLSTLFMTSHYTKEIRRLKRKIEEMNTQLYNPVGLHILWPQKVAFLFLEIEYY